MIKLDLEIRDILSQSKVGAEIITITKSLFDFSKLNQQPSSIVPYSVNKYSGPALYSYTKNYSAKRTL